jgi:hypothetical protein
MLVVDPALVPGASRGGAAVRNQCGPYGRTKGAKHTIAVYMTGLPAAAVVVPAGSDDGAAVEKLESEPVGQPTRAIHRGPRREGRRQRRPVATRGVPVDRVS